MRRIELTDLEIYAYHGVSEDERKKGGDFRVSVIMDVDFSAAEETDMLEDTVDYDAVFKVIKREMEVPAKLIEHVAGRIVKTLRKEFRPIQTVEVKLTKLRPPVEGLNGEVSVTIKV